MLQPAEFARLAEPLTALAKAAVELATYVEALANYLGLQQVASLSLPEWIQALLKIVGTIPADTAELADAVAMQDLQRIVQVSKVGIAWTDLRADYAEAYVDAAWDIPAAPLRLALTSGMSFFGRFRSSYRRASKVLATLITVPLPRSAQHRIALVDPLIAVEKAHKMKAEDAQMGSTCPPIGVVQKLTLCRYTMFHAPLSNWGPSLSSFESTASSRSHDKGLPKNTFPD